jgi:segregation and condensation protein B
VEWLEGQQNNNEREHMNLVEAALFASGKAMSAQELATSLGIASIGYVKKTAEALMEDYTKRSSPLCVIKIGDKYILSIKEPYASKVNNLAGQPEISKGALRILAYISKNEPLMQNSLVKAFGSSSYLYVKELLDNDFIKANRIGRTKKLETTNKFKEYFNFSK